MTHAEAAIAPVSLAMSPTAQLLLWLAVLAAAVLLLAFILLQVRRRLLGDESARGADAELSLEEIRRLKERGEISDREHRVLRAAAMARLGVAVEAPLDDDRESGGEATGGVGTTAEERRAEPGFDLTGEPLPPSSSSGESPGSGTGR